MMYVPEGSDKAAERAKQVYEAHRGPLATLEETDPNDSGITAQTKF